MRRQVVLRGLLIGLLAWPFVPAAVAADAPWRLTTALDAPGWLAVGGSYRVRYESLDSDFRVGSLRSDHILVEQLMLHAMASGEHLYAGVELEDARYQLARSPVGTDIVDTFESLQAYVGLRLAGVWQRDDRLDVAAGRMTIDAGSRRLIARNEFRNTANAFQGVHATWQAAAGTQLLAFYVLPVERRPATPKALRDNVTQLDTVSPRVRLWGVVASRPHLLGPVSGEVYAYGLRARDHDGIALADREIYTPGFRLYRKPATGAWDFEVEAAYQFGHSRPTPAPTDTRNLDHSAGFLHGHAGYTTEGRWRERVELSYDYASGDRNPADGTNNRFDPLYGARRFDFGPSGIYGPFIRSNISSPGLRVEATPAPRLNGFVGYRAVWLASPRDLLPAAGLQDPTGAAGTFVGQQLEVRLRYVALPGNLAFEVGGAVLFDGPFLRHAPLAPATGDTTYLYAATVLTF